MGYDTDVYIDIAATDKKEFARAAAAFIEQNGAWRETLNDIVNAVLNGGDPYLTLRSDTDALEPFANAVKHCACGEFTCTGEERDDNWVVEILNGKVTVRSSRTTFRNVWDDFTHEYGEKLPPALLNELQEWKKLHDLLTTVGGDQ